MSLSLHTCLDGIATPGRRRFEGCARRRLHVLLASVVQPRPESQTCARKPRPMSTTSRKISQALGPREVIAKAVRILMASHDVSEDAALDLLVRSASESQVGVRETARRIVATCRDS